MVEPRLTRQLYETDGEDAYIREAIALTQTGNRAQVRPEVQSAIAEAIQASAGREPALRNTFRQGYGAETAATAGMCYLLAYFEEWEGLDFESLRVELLDAEPGLSVLTPAQVAAVVSMGRATGRGPFDRSQERCLGHPAMRRIETALEPMYTSAISIPTIQRRHLDDFTYTWNVAKSIGLAVGVVDRAGLVPGGSSPRVN